MAACAETSYKFSLYDERTRADNFMLMDIFDDYNFVHVFQQWKHFVEALRKLFFRSVTNCCQVFKRIKITFLVICHLQPSESELLITCLL